MFLVAMQNTGTATWTQGGGYRLSSQAPQDNSIWGRNRVDLPAPVLPGSSATFSFDITAPGTPGTYAFQWRMVQENVEWFGDFSTQMNIEVMPEVSCVAIGPLNDGRLELWASSPGALLTTWKSTTNSRSAWVPWQDFAADAGAIAGRAQDIAVAPLSDGRLELWVIDGAGGLFSSWKVDTDPNANWTPWADFAADAGPLANGARQVAVAPLSDGRLELWVIDGAGGLFSSWKVDTDPNANWTPWADFTLDAGALPSPPRQAAVAAFRSQAAGVGRHRNRRSVLFRKGRRRPERGMVAVEPLRPGAVTGLMELTRAGAPR